MGRVEMKRDFAVLPDNAEVAGSIPARPTPSVGQPQSSRGYGRTNCSDPTDLGRQHDAAGPPAQRGAHTKNAWGDEPLHRQPGH